MRHIANRDQDQAWNGYEGTFWAANQDRWDGVNGDFDEPLLAAAAITGGDRVLDIGCGAGRTTRLAARRAATGGRWAWTCRPRCWAAHGSPRAARASAT